MILDARLKKLGRLRANLDRDLGRLAGHAGAQRAGELLKTALGRVQRGDQTVTILDYATGETVEVPLDPALDARANLERLFRRAKKASRGLPIVEARIREVEGQLSLLRAERARVARADPEALLREETDGRALHEPGKSPSRALGRRAAEIDRWARRMESADGHEIRVGRGAKENDRLTFSGARGHDLWLHARGVPGAHVLLRLSKGESPPEQALLDAAHLAVFFSGAKGEAKAEVVYTEARHVKKAKGAAPGSVTLSKEKTLLLRVEEDRLRRLLSR